MALTRRTFLNQAATITMAGSLAPHFLHAERLKEVGIELYTLRDDIEKDPLNVLKKVSAIGYNYIEIYPSNKGHYFGYQPDELKKITNGLGLRIISMMINSGRFQPEVKRTLNNDFPKLAEEAALLGVKYLICPWLHKEEYSSLDACYKTIDFLNNIASQAKKYGLKFAYHNHDFEFTPVEGKVPYNIFLERSDKNLVQFEMDLYWVVKGGKDPLDYFQHFPGRFPLWHIKDMDKVKSEDNADLGTGTLDFKSIYKESKLAGLEYSFVEQETYKGTPMEAAKTDYLYLKNLEF